MNGLRRVGISIFVVLGLVLAPTVSQAGAASFSPTPGEYFVDTSTLQLTGPGGPIATGVDEGGIAVFAFDSINIPAGAEIFAEGSRPFELRSAGAFTLAGLIEASGFGAEVFTPGPNPGGPGGGAGSTSGFEAGAGPGGGGATSDNSGGGGGGGFGGRGAAGGGPGPGASGPAYGDLNATFQGGSGGAGGTEVGGTDVGGGGGGGAVRLSASSLTIPASGEVFADGGDGRTGGFGASGAGSGGAIVLRADTIAVEGLVSAEGGDGGGGGCCGDGGGGGGGRIAFQYRTSLATAGTESVAGGASGAGGTLGSGLASPDATGEEGVVTKLQVATTATTSPASSISTTGATLNGVVNPKGIATTYHFELGTTTAYGTTVPVPDGAVVSDSSDHALSQAIAGLAPGTTYHYRIVASTLGFTTAGADMTFATECSGVKITKGRAKVKNGKAQIKLSSTGVCKGNLALFMKAPPKGKAKGHGKGKGSASKKGKGKGGKSIPIGSASFSFDAGQTKTVEVALSAAAIKRLKLGKALPATAKATTTDSLGAKKTTQANVSLKLAKKGKGPKKGKGGKRP